MGESRGTDVTELTCLEDIQNNISQSLFISLLPEHQSSTPYGTAIELMYAYLTCHSLGNFGETTKTLWNEFALVFWFVFGGQ